MNHDILMAMGGDLKPLEAELLEELVAKIVLELFAAQRAFPPFHSAHEGYALILEELDELWHFVKLKQSTPGRTELMREEAIQVAAMALRFLFDLPDFKN